MYGSHSRQKTYSDPSKRQDWTPGRTVKVGFLSLVVIAKVPTPGDYMPDAYALRSAAGAFYRFVPHNGIARCSDLAEAMSA